MSATALPAVEAAVRLRKATDSDAEFLYRVYASTRQEELAVVPWRAEDRERFLRSQFAAQDRFYRENYPGAEFDVISVDGVPSGRQYVHRRDDEIRIMDIALLPEHRDQGIGTYLLKQMLEQGAVARKKVTIHVEVFNRARMLYERLGFEKVETRGVYELMQWVPAGQQAPLETSGSTR